MKEIEEGCDNRRPTLWTDQCNRTGADISVCCIQMTAKHLAESMWKWMWSVMCCCIFVICIGLARAWVHQLSYWCHGKSMTTDIRLYPHVTQMRSWADCQSHGELHGKSAEQTVTVCLSSAFFQNKLMSNLFFYVVIYSPSCCSKSEWLFYLGTLKENISWRLMLLLFLVWMRKYMGKKTNMKWELWFTVMFHEQWHTFLF